MSWARVREWLRRALALRGRSDHAGHLLYELVGLERPSEEHREQCLPLLAEVASQVVAGGVTVTLTEWAGLSVEERAALVAARLGVGPRDPLPDVWQAPDPWLEGSRETRGLTTDEAKVAAAVRQIAGGGA